MTTSQVNERPALNNPALKQEVSNQSAMEEPASMPSPSSQSTVKLSWHNKTQRRESRSISLQYVHQSATLFRPLSSEVAVEQSAGMSDKILKQSSQSPPAESKSTSSRRPDDSSLSIHTKTTPVVEEKVTAKEETWQRVVWQLMPETPVGRALVTATKRLESRQINTAQLDSQVILAHILGVNRAWLFSHHDYRLTESEAEQFTGCIIRRMNYEPVAYLIGCKEFYGLEFKVDRRVLIPRPETELLVDTVLNHLEMRTDNLPIGHQLSVADVGTGCGAIAISVAANAPDVRVYATDISIDALEIARTNIQNLDKRCQVSLLKGDLLEPLTRKVDLPKVDVIAANLPYINSDDYAGLAPDVRDYEPQLALEAGPQGLDSIYRLLQQAPQHLNPNGIIILEIGHDQGDKVLQLVDMLIPDARFVQLRADYSGLDRLVTIGV